MRRLPARAKQGAHTKLLRLYFGLVAQTVTVEWEPPPQPGPRVWATWHRTWVAALVACIACEIEPPTFIGILSARGAAIGAAYEAFGGRSIRLTDPVFPDRLGARLRDIIAELKSGHACLIVPDGPSGPKYVAKPGAERAAQSAAVPLTVMTIAVRGCITAPRWDRLCVPLPFAHISISTSTRTTAASAERQPLIQK